MTLFEFSIFGLTIAPTWYGLMYALGFIICYEYVKKYGYLHPHDLDRFLFFVFLGVLFGGRLGYVLLYNLPYYLDHLSEVFAFWKGGMSFHGGALGVILSIVIFSWKRSYPIFDVADPLVTILPVALGLGRIGNLINRELLGFTSYTGPFAIIQGGVGHFPSPLLEALLEGVCLCIIMLIYRRHERKNRRIPGYASALFLAGYASFRLFAENFRLPDTQIGYLWGSDWITLGMIYTLPMLLLSGIVFLIARTTRREKISP